MSMSARRCALAFMIDDRNGYLLSPPVSSLASATASVIPGGARVRPKPDPKITAASLNSTAHARGFIRRRVTSRASPIGKAHCKEYFMPTDTCVRQRDKLWPASKRLASRKIHPDTGRCRQGILSTNSVPLIARSLRLAEFSAR